MTTALVVIEHDGKTAAASSAAVAAAAKRLADRVLAVVCGHNVAAIAAEVALIGGVDAVIQIDDPGLTHLPAEALTEQVLVQAKQLGAELTAVVAAASAFGKNLLPRVAACLDVAALTDVTEILSSDTFKRPIYAGNVIATYRSRDAIKVLTVRASSFEPLPAAAAATAVSTVAGQPASIAVPVRVALEQAQSDRPELSSAKVVVSGGRALGSAEQFKLLEPLAATLNAAIGASRAAVDAGYAPNDWQVGQTGKIVAPQLYIAVGISGAIQHLAGMSGSKVIVAINKDPDAPIFSVADYGLVADLFEAVPALTAALAASTNGQG